MLANVRWTALPKGASSWSVAIWAASMRALVAVLNISQRGNIWRGVDTTGHCRVRLPSKRQEIGAMIFIGLELVVTSRATLDYSFISRNWKDNFMACRLLPAVTNSGLQLNCGKMTRDLQLQQQPFCGRDVTGLHFWNRMAISVNTLWWDWHAVFNVVPCFPHCFLFLSTDQAVKLPWTGSHALYLWHVPLSGCLLILCCHRWQEFSPHISLIIRKQLVHQR